MDNALLRVAAAILLVMSASSAYAQPLSQDDPALFAEIRDTTITPFLTALKAGDVRAISRYLSEEIYEKEYKRLFESNEKYPEFLRQYYESVEFEVREISLDQANGIAEIDAYWSDGRILALRLQISRSDGDQSSTSTSANSWVVSSFPQ